MTTLGGPGFFDDVDAAWEKAERERCAAEDAALSAARFDGLDPEQRRFEQTCARELMGEDDLP